MDRDLNTTRVHSSNIRIHTSTCLVYLKCLGWNVSTNILERVDCDKDFIVLLRFADAFNFIYFRNFSQSLHVGHRKRALFTSFFSAFAIIRVAHKRNKWDCHSLLLLWEVSNIYFLFLIYLEEHEWYSITTSRVSLFVQMLLIRYSSSFSFTDVQKSWSWHVSL